jgi:hypothetical protein
VLSHRNRRPNTGQCPTIATTRTALQWGSDPRRTSIAPRPSCRRVSIALDISARRSSPKCVDAPPGASENSVGNVHVVEC